MPAVTTGATAATGELEDRASFIGEGVGAAYADDVHLQSRFPVESLDALLLDAQSVEPVLNNGGRLRTNAQLLLMDRSAP